MLLKKRGVSTVVATLLIVLITIVIGGIVATVVKQFTERSIEESAKCQLYRDYFTFDESFGLTCVNMSAGNITTFSLQAAQVNEELKTPLEGFNIVLSGNKDSIVADVRLNMSGSSALGGIWIFDDPSLVIKLPKQGEIITYAYNASQFYDRLEVYPVVEGEQICAKSDSILLESCGRVT